jgi:hypothetical protein
VHRLGRTYLERAACHTDLNLGRSIRKTKEKEGREILKRAKAERLAGNTAQANYRYYDSNSLDLGTRFEKIQLSQIGERDITLPIH